MTGTKDSKPGLDFCIAGNSMHLCGFIYLLVNLQLMLKSLQHYIIICIEKLHVQTDSDRLLADRLAAVSGNRLCDFIERQNLLPSFISKTEPFSFPGPPF